MVSVYDCLKLPCSRTQWLDLEHVKDSVHMPTKCIVVVVHTRGRCTKHLRQNQFGRGCTFFFQVQEILNEGGFSYQLQGVSQSTNRPAMWCKNTLSTAVQFCSNMGSWWHKHDSIQCSEKEKYSLRKISVDKLAVKLGKHRLMGKEKSSVNNRQQQKTRN